MRRLRTGFRRTRCRNGARTAAAIPRNDLAERPPVDSRQGRRRQIPAMKIGKGGHDGADLLLDLGDTQFRAAAGE